jgi:hypothetical protein
LRKGTLAFTGGNHPTWLKSFPPERSLSIGLCLCTTVWSPTEIQVPRYSSTFQVVYSLIGSRINDKTFDLVLVTKHPYFTSKVGYFCTSHSQFFGKFWLLFRISVATLYKKSTRNLSQELSAMNLWGFEVVGSAIGSLEPMTGFQVARSQTGRRSVAVSHSGIKMS